MLENDPFSMPPLNNPPAEAVQESFASMNFNQPLPAEEEKKGQQEIEDLLGGEQQKITLDGGKPPEIDAGGLFSMAGMETVRAEEKA